MSFGRIDVHGHLIPGVDDGCKTVDESAACARILVANGYTHAFATPHIWPNLPGNNVDDIRLAIQRLQAELDARAIPLRLSSGGEINLLSAWPALGKLPPQQIVTYALAGKYVLFDFWADDLSDCVEVLGPALTHLHSLGLKAILAHPERIAAIYRDPAAIDWFTDRGVLLQMNTWCLTEQHRAPIRIMAERLLAQDRYFLLGTDCHDPEGMAIRMRGLEIAKELAGEEAVDRMTKVNPQMLMGEEGK